MRSGKRKAIGAEPAGARFAREGRRGTNPYTGRAVTVRRLHDTGRTGWWALLVVVPIVGAIVLLIFAVLSSEPQANRYGDVPAADPCAPRASRGKRPERGRHARTCAIGTVGGIDAVQPR